MYATVADMREEGVTVAQATDERLVELLDEASGVIDRVCGWFFEPRQQRFCFDGRGTATIEPSVPPIRIATISLDGVDLSLEQACLQVIGSPVSASFDGPLLTLKKGIFPKGRGNVEVSGLWGYTEDDGTPQGRVPSNIRRACMLLALRWLAPVGDLASSRDFRYAWRIIEERTRDQSYKLDKLTSHPYLTGDPDVDALLVDYRRLPRLGAV